MAFTVFPAIDLLDGKVVRLKQGRYDEAKVYSDDPTDAAQRFEAEGAAWLHVVDLNGAKSGEPQNAQTIAAICRSVRCAVQLGGGLRSLIAIERAFNWGVRRVVLGTVAIRQPLFVCEAVKRFGADRFAVAVDVREGKVAVQGWTETEALSPLEIGKRLRDAGVCRFVYTDTVRDGTLTAPNTEAVAQFAEATQAQVIASGGIVTVEHVRQLKALEPLGVIGCIIGRALYEGTLTLREALDIARSG